MICNHVDQLVIVIAIFGLVTWAVGTFVGFRWGRQDMKEEKRISEESEIE